MVRAFTCADITARPSENQKSATKPLKRSIAAVRFIRSHLAMSSKPNVFQLQFLPEPSRVADRIWFARSLACTIVKGAAAILDVPAADLSATVAHTSAHSVPAIVLQDNIPGGARLVARLECRAIRERWPASRWSTSGQGARSWNLRSKDTNCYGCL